jgi:hypothetical protein
MPQFRIWCIKWRTLDLAADDMLKFVEDMQLRDVQPEFIKIEPDNGMWKLTIQWKE